MEIRKIMYLIFFLNIFLINSVSGQPDTLHKTKQPYTILKGTIGRENYQTYQEIPFSLPEGVKRLTVEFSYNKKDERTTIDLGIMDTKGIRGWSGGARNRFTLSREDATPGYLPGNLSAGEWKLLLGVPNIRVGVISEYEAKIFIETEPEVTEFSDTPIRAQAGWYRGDLHTHSGNSDAKCASLSGIQVPCPVFECVRAAVDKGLDFIALTDHNATIQSEFLRELQPAFDKILLVPGQEVSTFFGHANVFGLTKFLDFRMTQPSYDQARKWMDVVNSSNGIISINHPGIPSDENCMGCGWQIDNIPDNVITSIEVLNGATMGYSTEGAIQGWDLWHQMLASGRRMTAIGGSDDHHAAEESDKPGAIGNPTTVVYMNELSVKGLLDGIRSGRVYVDVEGNKDYFLNLSASNKGQEVQMGSVLKVAANDVIDLTVEVKGVSEAKVEFIIDGKLNADLTRIISPDSARIDAKWKADDKSHFIYVKIRNKDGRLVLFSNPIYIKTL